MSKYFKLALLGDKAQNTAVFAEPHTQFVKMDSLCCKTFLPFSFSSFFPLSKPPSSVPEHIAVPPPPRSPTRLHPPSPLHPPLPPPPAAPLPAPLSTICSFTCPPAHPRLVCPCCGKDLSAGIKAAQDIYIGRLRQLRRQKDLTIYVHPVPPVMDVRPHPHPVPSLTVPSCVCVHVCLVSASLANSGTRVCSHRAAANRR